MSGKSILALASAVMILTACLYGLAFLVQTFIAPEPLPENLDALYAEQGEPQYLASAIVIEPYDQPRSSSRNQLTIQNIRRFESAERITDVLLVYTDSRQARQIIEDFLENDLPAGRWRRTAALFPRPDYEVYRLDAQGNVVEERHLSLPFLKLTSVQTMP